MEKVNEVIAAKNIVAEVYARKCMNIFLKRKQMGENNMTDEQKEFYEDLRMEQQEQM